MTVNAILFGPANLAIYDQRRFIEIWHARVKPDSFAYGNHAAKTFFFRWGA